MGLFSRKRQPVMEYDRENTYPVYVSSICTGETTAGFRNKHTKKYTEVMLIASEEDRYEFLSRYGLKPEEVKQEY